MALSAQETVFSQQLLDENPVVVKRFRLPIGQNSKDQPDAIGEAQVATLQNADTTARGVSTTRAGVTQIADDVGNIRIVGLERYYVEGGTKYLLMVADTTAYSWGGSGNWTALTGFTPTTDLITNILIAGNEAFFLNGTDDVYSTADGATLSDEGNTNTDFPKTRFGIYHQNRGIVAGNGTNQSYVWFSNVLDLHTWDRSANALKIDDQNGDAITALVNLSLTQSQGFIVFKNRSTHFVLFDGSTPDKSVIVNIDPVHGCVGSRAAAVVGSSLLSGDAVYLSKEGSTYRLRSLKRTISDAIGTGGILSESIEDILTGTNVNAAKMSNAIVYYFDERIFLAFPSGSSSYNDTVAVLDLKNSDPNTNDWKWSVFAGWNAGAFAIYEESSVEYLYMGEGSADSVVYRALNGTSDNGTAIQFIEETRREDFGYPELYKIFQFVEVEFLATDDTLVAVSAQIDGNGYTTLDTVNVKSSAPSLPISLPFNLVGANKVRNVFQLDDLGRGRDVQIKIVHSDVDKTVKVLGYTIVAFLEPLRLETES